jgi:hypothetical protein
MKILIFDPNRTSKYSKKGRNTAVKKWIDTQLNEVFSDDQKLLLGKHQLN